MSKSQGLAPRISGLVGETGGCSIAQDPRLSRSLAILGAVEWWVGASIGAISRKEGQSLPERTRWTKARRQEAAPCVGGSVPRELLRQHDGVQREAVRRPVRVGRDVLLDPKWDMAGLLVNLGESPPASGKSRGSSLMRLCARQEGPGSLSPTHRRSKTLSVWPLGCPDPRLFYSSCRLGQDVRALQPSLSRIQDKPRLVERGTYPVPGAYIATPWLLPGERTVLSA